jgi:hypothetical protein
MFKQSPDEYSIKETRSFGEARRSDQSYKEEEDRVPEDHLVGLASVRISAQVEEDRVHEDLLVRLLGVR